MIWTTTTLSEICNIDIGGTPSRNEPRYWHGTNPWVSISDMTCKTITTTRERITNDGVKESNVKRVPKGTLMMSFKLSLGKLAFSGVPLFTNEAIAALPIIDKNQVDGGFLFYALQTIKWNESGRRAVKGNCLNKEILEDTKVAYPPLDEQKRIAALLDKADRLRRTRRYAQQLSDTFLQSVFLDMFGDPLTNPMGWDIHTLDQHFLAPPSLGTTTPATENGDQLCVRVGEVGNWSINLEDCKFTSLTGRDLDKFTLVPNDIVFARAIGSESHLGKLSIFQGWYKPVVFDSHVMRIRLHTTSLNELFFATWLRTDAGRAIFLKQSRRTAVQFNINSEQISSLKLPVPPIAKQQEFANIVRRFERLRAQQREAERQADHLFQTVLHQAFQAEPHAPVPAKPPVQAAMSF